MLRGGALHGYAIARKIQLLSNDELQVEEGSLYPALQKLLIKGFVTAEWDVSDSGARGPGLSADASRQKTARNRAVGVQAYDVRHRKHHRHRVEERRHDPWRVGRRAWYVLNRRRFERELADEMAAHREMLGDPQRFGNALRIREEAREAWVARWLDEAWQDLRYAVRSLVRAPLFAASVILILAFGIGLNLAFFQLLNVMALRPPNVRSPETLVQFHRIAKNFQSNGVPYPATQFIKEHNGGFPP